MEEWAEINEFPGYSVSNEGRVCNNATDRIMAQRINQQGIRFVGLTKKGKQHNRSVAVLVADAFIDKPDQTRMPFDTPIHLDGDRSNCAVWNLMWRPRWFAAKYHRQFIEFEDGIDKPIRDRGTHQVWPSSRAIATEFGVLEKDVVSSVATGRYVFPTFQEFEMAN